MKSDFITYQKFNDRNSVVEYSVVLDENNIDWEIEDASARFDASFANNEFTKEFRIKIKQEDFERADELFFALAQAELSEVPADYYLFDFTNDELIQLIEKSDEWSKFDYLLTQKILKDRGVSISTEFLERSKTERLNELSKPESSPSFWITLGYVFALLGGFLGLLIGWHLKTHKRTLPNGERIYAYTENDRKHGKTILIIALITVALATVLQIALKESFYLNFF